MLKHNRIEILKEIVKYLFLADLNISLNIYESEYYKPL